MSRQGKRQPPPGVKETQNGLSSGQEVGRKALFSTFFFEYDDGFIRQERMAVE